MPPCRLRRRQFWKFDYEMVHSEVYLNKHVVSIAPFSTPACPDCSLCCMFLLFNFSSIFPGGSADPICPYVWTPMPLTLPRHFLTDVKNCPHFKVFPTSGHHASVFNCIETTDMYFHVQSMNVCFRATLNRKLGNGQWFIPHHHAQFLSTQQILLPSKVFHFLTASAFVMSTKASYAGKQIVPSFAVPVEVGKFLERRTPVVEVAEVLALVAACTRLEGADAAALAAFTLLVEPLQTVVARRNAVVSVAKPVGNEVSDVRVVTWWPCTLYSWLRYCHSTPHICCSVPKTE